MATEAYNNAKDPFYQSGVHVAKGMTPIVASDTNDLANYAIIYALTAGTVAFVPVYGDDSNPISMTVPVGWQSPCVCRRVMQTGTSASLATLDKIV